MARMRPIALQMHPSGRRIGVGLPILAGFGKGGVTYHDGLEAGSPAGLGRGAVHRSESRRIVGVTRSARGARRAPEKPGQPDRGGLQHHRRTAGEGRGGRRHLRRTSGFGLDLPPIRSAPLKARSRRGRILRRGAADMGSRGSPEGRWEELRRRGRWWVAAAAGVASGAWRSGV